MEALQGDRPGGGDLQMADGLGLAGRVGLGTYRLAAVLGMIGAELGDLEAPAVVPAHNRVPGLVVCELGHQSISHARDHSAAVTPSPITGPSQCDVAGGGCDNACPLPSH